MDRLQWRMMGGLAAIHLRGNTPCHHDPHPVYNTQALIQLFLYLLEDRNQTRNNEQEKTMEQQKNYSDFIHFIFFKLVANTSQGFSNLLLLSDKEQMWLVCVREHERS